MGKHYIDNKEFERIILSYQQEPEKFEEEFVNLFDLLISNILESFKFNVDKEDAKQECFLLVLKVAQNFRPKKGTAFNFFTTVIVNNLKLLYTKDKRYNEKIDNYTKKMERDFKP